MSFWRMQLHPAESDKATEHSVKCLSNGYIGLDFDNVMDDLTSYDPMKLETTPNNVRAFALSILKSDFILVFHHNIPLALVSDIEDYNYIKNTVPEMGIWFRHFRKFGKISYYNDVYKQGFDEHYKIVMANTFSEASLSSNSGKLIQNWIDKIGW